MIDSDLIIKYTDALYGSTPENSPRYEEFRDMFSSGQIKSKTWLVGELSKLNLDIKSICICGSWFGTLAFFLNKVFPSALIKCIDVDARCINFIKILRHSPPESDWLEAGLEDMYKSTFDQDCIINTSSEHILNVSDWLKILPPGKIVILQSTDYQTPADHVSTVRSIEEFELKTTSYFKKIYFKGELKLNVYTRFMIIGLT